VTGCGKIYFYLFTTVAEVGDNCCKYQFDFLRRTAFFNRTVDRIMRYADLLCMAESAGSRVLAGLKDFILQIPKCIFARRIGL
jgi:hypothetical protein